MPDVNNLFPGTKGRVWKVTTYALEGVEDYYLWGTTGWDLVISQTRADSKEAQVKVIIELEKMFDEAGAPEPITRKDLLDAAHVIASAIRAATPKYPGGLGIFS
jgi:hypothetical protein